MEDRGGSCTTWPFVSRLPCLISKINQSLYSTTFLAYGAGARFCSECMMADHSQEACALHPNRALPVVQMQEVRRGGREEPCPRPPDGYKRRAGRRGPCF